MRCRGVARAFAASLLHVSRKSEHPLWVWRVGAVYLLQRVFGRDTARAHRCDDLFTLSTPRPRLRRSREPSRPSAVRVCWRPRRACGVPPYGYAISRGRAAVSHVKASEVRAEGPQRARSVSVERVDIDIQVTSVSDNPADISNSFTAHPTKATKLRVTRAASATPRRSARCGSHKGCRCGRGSSRQSSPSWPRLFACTSNHQLRIMLRSRDPSTQCHQHAGR